MNKKKYVLGSKNINRFTKKLYVPVSYRNKDYINKYNKGLIEPRDIKENKIFSQIDLIYINEVNKLIKM